MYAGCGTSSYTGTGYARKHGWAITATARTTSTSANSKKETDVDTIKKLTDPMLTEREVIIFMLVENTGQDYRTIGAWLNLSHENIRKTYERAKTKMDVFANAGMFSTEVKPKQ